MTEEMPEFQGFCGQGCIQWKIESDHACRRCEIVMDQEREDLGLDDEGFDEWNPY